MINEQIQSFAVLHTLQSFQQLRGVLRVYEEPCARFGHSKKPRQRLPSKMFGKVYQGYSTVIGPGKVLMTLKKQLNILARSFAELSLLVRKRDGPIKTVHSLRPGLVNVTVRNGRACEYCRRSGYMVTDCWKRERHNKIFSFCNNKGHDAEDCWARVEREQGVQESRDQDQVNVLQIAGINTDEDEKGVTVNAICDQNGEPLPKQRNLENTGQNASKQMKIRNFIHNEPMKKKKSALSQRKKPYKKKTQKIAGNSLTERLEHYDLISSTAHANAEINLGQFLWDDATNAAVGTKRLFSGCARKRCWLL